MTKLGRERSAPAPQHSESGAARRRGALCVILSSALLGVSYSYSMPLISLRLDSAGADTWTIGLVAAMTGLSVLVAVPLVPHLVHRLRSTGLLVLGSFLVTVAMAGTAVTEGWAAWAALRFVFGIGVGIHWIASETWLNRVATEGRRGRLLATYVAGVVVGFALGPALLSVIGAASPSAMLVGIAASALVAVPLLAIGGPGPRTPRASETRPWRYLALLPLAMAASLLTGVLEAAATALLPLYGRSIGLGRPGSVLGLSFADLAALTLVAFTVGNVILQVPAAWAADRLPVRPALIGCATIAAVAAFLVPAVTGSTLLWALLVLWGGAAFALYTLGLAELGRRVTPEGMAAANGAYILCYQLGTMVGPLLISGAMSGFGAEALPLGMGAAALCFVAAAALSRRR